MQQGRTKNGSYPPTPSRPGQAEHCHRCSTVCRGVTSLDLPPWCSAQEINKQQPAPYAGTELARRLDSSEGHLSRTFHRATGLRLVDYVARYRAERARVLLRGTERPITDIAFACGFQSLSQFHRVFRAQFGKRPRDIRTEVLPGAN